MRAIFSFDDLHIKRSPAWRPPTKKAIRSGMTLHLLARPEGLLRASMPFAPSGSSSLRYDVQIRSCEFVEPT